MKKLLCTFLSMLLMITPITVCAYSNNANLLSNYVTNSDVYEGSYSSESVLNLYASELNEQNNNFLKDFIAKGGILVVDNDTDDSASLCKDLNMQIEPEFINSEDQRDNRTVNNIGTDIATIYYNYGNGLSGIYVINAANNITNLEKEKLISEAIDTIHNIQNSHNSSSIQPLASGTKKALGNFTVTSTLLPKGKLSVTYEFFTVQNYYGKDYYTVKAQVVGMPGSDLASSRPEYKSKYHGLSQKTTIKTTTSSVTIDSYGPQRIDKNSSYSVSVGASFGETGGTSFSANFNYTQEMPETDIEATRTTTQAVWDVTLRNGARKRTCTFIPAVTFACPDSKSAISLSLSSDYVLDSWDTFKEAVSVSRNVTCNPNSYSQS